MATVFYPDNIPSNTDVDLLLHTRRSLRSNRNSTNVAVIVDDRHVLNAPEQYVAHLKRFFWREDALRVILIKFMDDDALSITLEGNLKCILQYMDAVFKEFVADMGRHKGSDDAFRCRLFDHYLSIEFWVRRHEPRNVLKYRYDHEQSLDRCDALKLGKS